MFGITRTGFQAFADAVWSLVSLANRTVTPSGGTITTVTGNVNGTVQGVLGNVTGHVLGSVAGDVAGNLLGVITGTNAIPAAALAQGAADKVWNTSLVAVTAKGVSVNATDGVALATHASGHLPSDGRAWNGSAVATPNVAGVPLVDTHYHRGTAESILISGRRDVNVGAMQNNVVTASAIAASALNGKGDWNIGKSGYSLTAGSYNVAEHSQRGTVANAGGGSNTGNTGISTSDVDRSHMSNVGATDNAGGNATARLTFTSTAVFTTTPSGSVINTCGFEVITVAGTN